MEMIVLSNAKKKVTADQRSRKKDVVSNRISVFFIVLLVVVFAILSLKGSYISTELMLYNYVRPILVPLFAIATLCAGTLWIFRRKQKVDESMNVFSSSLLTCVSAGLFAVCLLYPYLSTTRLMISLLSCALLFFVYYLYPRGFFAYSLCTVVGALALSFLHFGNSLLGVIIPVALVAAVLVLSVIILLAPTSRMVGQLSLAQMERYPMIVTAALLLAGLIVGFVMPSLIFYAVVLLAGWFMVVAIINTLRLI